jgi:hypothetical protein
VKASKKPAAQTAKERVHAMELADRIARAKAKTPAQDPTGEHHVSIAAIARASGRDVVELLDLWDERAAIRQYDGGQSRADAEAGAVTDIEAQFAPMQGTLL